MPKTPKEQDRGPENKQFFRGKAKNRTTKQRTVFEAGTHCNKFTRGGDRETHKTVGQKKENFRKQGSVVETAWLKGMEEKIATK